jgi:Dna[CI] antecedent, DciA
MTARSKPVDKLGNILPRVLRRQPGGARLMGTQVASAFRTVIGSEPAGLCNEIELHSGTLVVTTSSPALAHQLRLDSEVILGRLNKLELGRKVRALRVRIGHSTPSQ